MYGECFFGFFIVVGGYGDVIVFCDEVFGDCMIDFLIVIGDEDDVLSIYGGIFDLY